MNAPAPCIQSPYALGDMDELIKSLQTLASIHGIDVPTPTPGSKNSAATAVSQSRDRRFVPWLRHQIYPQSTTSRTLHLPYVTNPTTPSLPAGSSFAEPVLAPRLSAAPLQAKWRVQKRNAEAAAMSRGSVPGVGLSTMEELVHVVQNKNKIID